jgi:hypothetical protein
VHRLDAFYVEVFYDQENNEILRYEGFTNTKRLVPYLSFNVNKISPSDHTLIFQLIHGS